MADGNSNLVANQLASPQVFNPKGKLGGRVRIACDNFESPTLTDAADVIRLVNLPSSAIPLSIKICNDDLDSGTDIAFDLGIYPVNADGTVGTVHDLDAFASVSVIFQTVSLLTEMMDESATAAQKALIGDPLWQWAGLTADPGGMLCIAITISTDAATDVPGTIGFQIEYVLD